MMSARTLLIAALSFALASPALSQKPPRVLFTTTLGEFEVEVDSISAPATAAVFRYVDGGFCNKGRFHRTVTMANQPNNAVKIRHFREPGNPVSSPFVIPAKARIHGEGTVDSRGNDGGAPLAARH